MITLMLIFGPLMITIALYVGYFYGANAMYSSLLKEGKETGSIKLGYDTYHMEKL